MKLKYRAGGGFTRSSGSFKPTGNQMTIGTGTSRSFRAGGALADMAKRYAAGGRPNVPNEQGTGNGAGQPEARIDSQDPGFQDWLRATGTPYHQEYMGEPLTAGGGSGSFRGELGESSYTAVNPALLPEVSEQFRGEQFGSMKGRGGAGGARPTRGEQMDESARLYQENLAAEQAYQAWLAKQKGRPAPRQTEYRFEDAPGGEGGTLFVR